jgi:hypothetical protein
MDNDRERLPADRHRRPIGIRVLGMHSDDNAGVLYQAAALERLASPSDE